MEADTKTSEIKRELVFSTYVQNKFRRNEDSLFVKEIIHHPDGRTKRRLRQIINYPRSFYFTKPDYRNHKQKKEFEHLQKLDVYQTNQANLARTIFYAINGYPPQGYVSTYDMSSSPYLYGSDVTTPVLLANDYRIKYPNLSSPSTLAVMDYEWSVINETSELLAGVLSFKEKLHIAITKDFIGNLASTAKEDILKALNIHLKEYIVGRHINPIITIVDNTAELVKTLMASAHEWQPDFLGFWNMSGDIEKMIEALKSADIDPADVFSDPSVPKEYRSFKWRKDTPYKVTSAGKRTPKHHADQWHTVIAPASFYCVCLMAIHRAVRGREQYRSSYALDSVLHDFLDLGKLRFSSVPEGLVGVDWHREMQQNHKIEYMVYLAFDGISVELLDEKTNDVSKSLRGSIGLSELSKMKSNPKRLADDKHFTLLKDSKVIASTSSNMIDELDKETPSINGWIITLAPELEHGMGRCLLNEYPAMQTNITTHAFDVDVISAYPESEVSLNVSKTTRIFELCKIDKLPTSKQREVGINLTNLHSNALSIATLTHDFPSLTSLLEEYKKELQMT